MLPGTVRSSEAPLAIDVAARPSLRASAPRRARWWVGMGGYLAVGILLGIALIAALSVGRGSEANAAAPPSSLVTDAVVRLHAKDIGSTCWQGYERLGPARLTVALEVGVDGRIRYANASGETPFMRACVEAHVRTWEFLPQREAQTMALPVEVDRR